MPVKLVVFDIAGTTVKDTSSSVSNVFRSALSQFGYIVPPEEVYPLMGYEKKLAIKTMVTQHEEDPEEITDELIEKIHRVFVKEMIAHYSTDAGIEAFSGVEETFAKLHEQGVKVCLNSGFSQVIVETILKRLQWAEKGLIDHYLASDQVANGRPDPTMIYKLMSLCGITDAKQVIKIGDTEVDIREGQNAGCLYSIGITTGAFTREELKAYNPDYIFDNITELLPLIAGEA